MPEGTKSVSETIGRLGGGGFVGTGSPTTSEELQTAEEIAKKSIGRLGGGGFVGTGSPITSEELNTAEEMKSEKLG
jgi:hypothetical protein